MMQGRVNNTHNPIPGVKCVVNTCAYHDQHDHCTAQAIEIQPRNAKNTEETDCATFTPNNL